MRQNCTLILRVDGNLELLESSNVTWSINIRKPKAVAMMALLESGNLVLGPSKDISVNNSVWQSFDSPTDTLITGQKLKLNTVMYAAMKNRPQTSGGVYSMRVVNLTHDLSLFADFAHPYDYGLPVPDYNQTFGAEPYWTMNTAYMPIADSWVAGGGSYAELNNGLRVYDENGNLELSVPTYTNLTYLEYARLLPDGNLESFVFREGEWKLNFQAIDSQCLLPNACGPYGICEEVSGRSNTKCTGCPPGFRLLNGSDPTQGCEVLQPLAGNCSIGATETREIEFVNITGYTYFAIGSFYSGGTKANVYPQEVVSSPKECQSLCQRNCSCGVAIHAFIENNSSEVCFMLSSLQSILAAPNNNQTTFIKISKSSPLVAPSPQVTSGALSPSPGFNIPVPSPSLGSDSRTSGHSHVLKRVGIAIAGVAGGLVCTLLVSSLCCLWVSRRKSKAQTADDEMFLDTLPGLPPRFSYKDLTIATNNFNKKLGEGGFGSVYEGILADKSKIAVKELEDMGQGTKEFRAEVATIGSISHVHLVPLRGFCIEGPHRLLVYQFMLNGSLDKFLFKRKASTPFLDLQNRKAVALGAARGLAYLHEECTSRIIHCDVKPENILLDERLAARVADFGLAKLMNRDQSYMVTTMRGTRGYMAPEWLKNTPITEKGDVYSFGVVLLELMSGRRNFKQDAAEEIQCFLPTWAVSLLESEGDNKLLEIVDPLLDVQNMTAAEQQTCRNMLLVALWCLQEDAAMRPAMGNVEKMLQGNVEVPKPPVSDALFYYGKDLSMAPSPSNNSSQSSFELKRHKDFASTQASQITEVRPR